MIPEPYATHWQDLQMCKVYHCTPNELDDEDLWRVELHQQLQGAVDSYIRYENASERRRLERQRK